MSDNYLRVIPVDPRYVPPDTAARAAVALLGPAVPNADEVVAEAHGHPVFIDQGSNLEAIICPTCGARLSFYKGPDADHGPPRRRERGGAEGRHDVLPIVHPVFRSFV